MDIFVIVVLIVVIILILKLIGKYNTFVEYLNKVKSSESGIDVYLNQRFDLIPNLVECVKGYTSHEKELLENITKQRTDYSQNKNLKEASKLNNNLNKVMVVAENYPELKASEQFLNLQNNLVKMENQLQAARRIYNLDVERYNSTIQTVPNNLVAFLFGFKPKEFFQIEEYKRENVNVNGEKM
ncbi:MAG: LemA family protein [Clostridia bacterium]|nr:LemA family protein [Clostridia bacterium]